MMSITVPTSPVAVELRSTSGDRPIVVRAHARKRATFRYTERMREEDRATLAADKRARFYALFDEFLSEVDRAVTRAEHPGLVATRYRWMLADLAVY